MDPHDLELILLSGAKAPSAKNEQPWHFTVITNYEIGNELLRFVLPGSVLIVISGTRDVTVDLMVFDTALATQNMQLAAEALGYGARIFIEPVWEIERQRERLGIPYGYEVIMALLVSHVRPDVDVISAATPRNALSYHVNFVD